MGERRPIVGKIADALGQVPKVGPALQEGVETIGYWVAPTDLQRRQRKILDRWEQMVGGDIFYNDRLTDEEAMRRLAEHDQRYSEQLAKIKRGTSDLGEEIRG